MNDEKVAPQATLDEDVRVKLNKETGKIVWQELEKHFAAGNVVTVAAELDLIEVAYQVSQDNKTAVENWVAKQQLGAATDEQAAQWQAANSEFWAVVVAPLVLVQLVKS